MTARCRLELSSFALKRLTFGINVLAAGHEQLLPCLRFHWCEESVWSEAYRYATKLRLVVARFNLKRVLDPNESLRELRQRDRFLCGDGRNLSAAVTRKRRCVPGLVYSKDLRLQFYGKS